MTARFTRLALPRAARQRHPAGAHPARTGGADPRACRPVRHRARRAPVPYLPGRHLPAIHALERSPAGPQARLQLRSVGIPAGPQALRLPRHAGESPGGSTPGRLRRRSPSGPGTQSRCCTGSTRTASTVRTSVGSQRHGERAGRRGLTDADGRRWLSAFARAACLL